MTTLEVKDRLLAELKHAQYGASTRFLCNQIFRENHAKYIVHPGDHRMKQVYGYLKTLSRQGKVISDYPGHWRFNHQNSDTPPPSEVLHSAAFSEGYSYPP